jgi:hypothetical protein
VKKTDGVGFVIYVGEKPLKNPYFYECMGNTGDKNMIFKIIRARRVISVLLISVMNVK